MSFLNPWLLMGVLAGIGVPVFIHLFSRYRSRPMDWAAMELLRRALVVRARRIRLEDLILLLLRILAGVLAALALARPTLSRGSAGLLGSKANVAVVVAVDGSYSMAHKGGVKDSRFDLARKRTSDILNTLSPGVDKVTLVLMGRRPTILLRNVAFDPEHIGEVLKSLEPLSEGLNLDVNLEELQRLVDEMQAASRELYFVTDGQSATWKDVSSAAKQTMTALSDACNTYVVPVGPENSDDIAVTRLDVAGGTMRRGSTVRYLAQVRNSGQREAVNVTVRLHVDGIAVDQQTIESIAPRSTQTVPFFAYFESSGAYSVSAELPEDALDIDNARYAITDIRDTVSILCVDGNPSTEPFGGQTGYLAAALAPLGGRDGAAGSGSVEVRTIGVDSLRAESLAATDVVMMANVAELSREQTWALASFVRRGGGLMVFLGNKVSADAANNALRDMDGSPLLPAQLETVIGSAAPAPRPGIDPVKPDRTVWTLDPRIPIHPVTSFLRDMKPDQLKGVQVRCYVKMNANPDARVLLQLTPGGDPILAEKSLGRGKVLMLATSANRDWTEIVVHPSYLMLVQQTVAYLTRKGYETPLSVGEAPVFELPSDAAGTTVKARSPDHKEVTANISERNGRKTAVLPESALPGIYTLQWAPDAPELKLAVNVDDREAAIEVLRGGDLEDAVDELSARLIPEGRDVAAAVRDYRLGQELWRTLIVLALVVLVVEAVLAFWFVQRMAATPVPAAEMSRTI